MATPWRLLDTGLRPPAENIAFNRALLEAKQAGECPNTLRFLRFFPSALLGYHQSAEQELNLDYCRERGIAIQRRITGGGAIYFDEGQMGWELYLSRKELGGADMEAVSRRICTAAARGISSLGVNAVFRPRNDIEVEGRKISGTGGVFDGDALMFQGTLLLRFDVETMVKTLRIPAEKLSDKAISSARQRVTDLTDLLGYTPGLEKVQAALADAFSAEFGVTFEPGSWNEAEEKRYREALAEVEAPQWLALVTRPGSDMPIVEAERKFPGGLLRVALAYDRPRRRISQAWFSGDCFVTPRRTLADLEAVLRNSLAHEAEDRVRAFFSARPVEMLLLTPEDFVSILRQALAQ